ncbi:urease accessory protein UreD [Acerihabitans arboris]|uniref:Urease accessory protein UreD n=1 Tax=Acerihabitans arboris TaxID=2691583 RepID=A0A845SJJ0_9GAMM|nr:urease accessory protein UreD [Acerihabitans arboris]NDL65383.1 urease accessory protein UreD [Acerihabitans arboris]
MTNDTVLADPSPRAHPGWLGKLQLGFELRRGRTLLTTRRHSGPYRVQRAFYPQADHPHVYLLHPPGGVVGGDRLELSVTLDAGSHALLTMPGATKFYRSAGELARVSQRFLLGEGSILEWLPQDNIFFPAARVAIDTEFRLSPGARLLGFDTLCLGRPAAGEAFTDGCLNASLRIILPGCPGLFERLRIGAGRLEKLGGYPLSATFYATPVSEAMLAGVRLLLEEAAVPAAGASLLDSLLVVRVLDNDNQRLQQLLHRIWAYLRPRMLGLDAVAPRIWAT